MPAHTSTPYPHADTTDNDITITPAGGISLVVNEETSDEYNDDTVADNNDDTVVDNNDDTVANNNDDTVPIGNDDDNTMQSTGRNNINNDHCAYFFLLNFGIYYGVTRSPFLGR